MNVRLRVLGGGSDEHPSLDGEGTAAAVAAQVTPAGTILARVSLQVPYPIALTYEHLPEAVALIVEVPAHGVCRSDLLVDRDERRIRPYGPSRREGPVNAPEGLLLLVQATAEVELSPPPDRPLTLYVRAAFRDALSAPCRVDLDPRGGE